jgi:hypothetical protein
VHLGLPKRHLLALKVQPLLEHRPTGHRQLLRHRRLSQLHERDE